jgi:ferrous iron transport protein A
MKCERVLFDERSPERLRFLSKLKLDFNNDTTMRINGSQALPLADLPVGESGVILSIDLTTAIGRRLGDLGFLPGTDVRVLSRAPLGDPTVYELRGTRLCLRRSEASRIEVQPAVSRADD